MKLKVINFGHVFGENQIQEVENKWITLKKEFLILNFILSAAFKVKKLSLYLNIAILYILVDESG